MPISKDTLVCAVCTTAPAGFGWAAPPPRISILSGRSDQSRAQNRTQKRFCSMACQSLFASAIQRGDVVNREQLDRQAKQDALHALGDYVMQVGIHKPLNDYSQAQAHGIVTAVLNAYQHSLITHFPKES